MRDRSTGEYLCWGWVLYDITPSKNFEKCYKLDLGAKLAR